MIETSRCEQYFLQHLPIIDRVCTVTAISRGIRSDDIGDVVGWVRLRLIENEYAVIRKFRGESAFSTFVTTVVVALVRDLDVHERGRWRASAEATRLGPVAVQLEYLVHRKRLSLNEAFEHLRTARVTDWSDRQLATLYAALPHREPMRPTAVSDTSLTDMPADSATDLTIIIEEATKAREHVAQLIERWIHSLSTEQQVMLKMRFWHSKSVADIARALDVKQKPLYRQFDHLLSELKASLRAQGITEQRFRELFGEHLT